MPQYSYTKTEQPDLYKFAKDVEASELLDITDYQGASWDAGVEENNLVITWAIDLTGDPKAELDSIVAALPSGDSSPRPGSQKSFEDTFCTEDAPYLTETANDYAVVCQFVFPGRSEMGDIKSAKVIVWASGGYAGAVRLYDATNALQIAEKTDVDNTTAQILDLGEVDNVPDDAAIWEIQVKAAAGESIMIAAYNILFY